MTKKSKPVIQNLNSGIFKWNFMIGNNETTKMYCPFILSRKYDKRIIECSVKKIVIPDKDYWHWIFASKFDNFKCQRRKKSHFTKASGK